MNQQHTVSVRAYVLVLMSLLVLTAATVGVSLLPLAGGWHIVGGLAIAVVKASLVVLVFMHVMSSPKLTWIVIAVALFWLVLLFGLTFCDYATRGLIPGMPGH
ncbi:MAG TPA: cytochrome C oxidase subunit IV family protein [Pirellulales bacterium]|jgi:cytochrome c oxidase subunit 4|nr:cytochrome C oxidase subunit IV family protein [Pirellulales bacterium]